MNQRRSESDSPLPQLSVLYHDESLLVVDKPSGLLVHRGWGDDAVTALSLARSIAGRWVYPVHRLDRGTSGVLVFTLSPQLAKSVQESFAGGDVAKRYLALTRGAAPEVESLIDHPIAKEKGKPRVAARTRVRRLELFRLPPQQEQRRVYSWVAAMPETGRPHQIRRHLKHISHPIVGDVRYGKSEHNRFFRDKYQTHRLLLHAEALSMPHPVTGQSLLFQAPEPMQLVELLARLRADCV